MGLSIQNKDIAEIKERGYRRELYRW